MPSAARSDSPVATAGLWAPVGIAAIVIGAILALFHETVLATVGTWAASATFGHCFLIAPVSAYLAWQRRGELAGIEPRPSLSGIAVIAVACLAWLLGHATETTVVEELSVVAVIQGSVLAIYGWGICQRLLFPLLYLYFAVPFGQALVPPLQAVTADLAVGMLRGIGIPVFADGNVISVPGGSFYVAEACSGIRYLIASVALGTLFAWIAYRSWWRRAVFLAVSAAIPILANGARAFGIIAISQMTSNDFAMGVDHLIYGWLFFALVMALMLAAGFAFRDWAPAGAPIASARAPSRGVLSAGLPRRLAIAGLVALLPVVMVRLYASHLDRQPADLAVHLLPPEIAGGWQRLDGVEDTSAVVLAAPDAEVHGAYGDGRRRVYLHIGYYAINRRGAQAVSSDHAFDSANRWTSAASGTATATIDGEARPVQYLRMVKGRTGHLLWYWYWVDGRFTANAYVAKLLEAKAKLLGGEQRAAIVVVAADYTDTSAEAEDALRRFLADLRGLGADLDRS